MIDKERLRRDAAGFEIELTPQMLEQLDLYAGLLLEWNQKINLTAITQPREVEVKHFLDSLLLAAQPEVDGKLVDVGSGAGFPGLVAKIYKPDLALTLMEPTGKRLNFLQTVAGQLGIEAEFAKERAEEAGRKHWREAFDAATARAVAAMPALCEYCLPLVKPGGWFVAMKAEAGEEVEAAAGAIATLGGGAPAVRGYTLPGEQARSLILVQKVKQTPDKYPRNGGVISKRPLA